MSIIILGDPHIGKSLSIGKAGIGANLNSRISDQIKLLDWTLEQAIENHSDIIITGDVFEEPKPAPSIITIFISWLKRCQAYNVNVHILVGNHDILRNGAIYSSPLDIISEVELDNTSIYKDINTIFIDTTAFTLIPFRDRKSLGANSGKEALELISNTLNYELAGIPSTYKKVVVGHLAIEGSIPVGDEIDDLTNELFCPLSMFSGYDVVWMGHVHKYQVMQKNNPHIAHIGSMDISNFGESDQEKHIICFNTDEGTWYTKKLPTRNLKKISIVVPSDIEDTTDYVLKEIDKYDSFDKSIVKMDISLSSSDSKSINKSIIEKKINSLGAFNIAGISESKKAKLIKKDASKSLDTKMDVMSAIKMYAENYIDKSINDKFIELAVEIYNQYKLESKE